MVLVPVGSSPLLRPDLIRVVESRSDGNKMTALVSPMSIMCVNQLMGLSAIMVTTSVI